MPMKNDFSREGLFSMMILHNHFARVTLITRTSLVSGRGPPRWRPCPGPGRTRGGRGSRRAHLGELVREREGEHSRLLLVRRPNAEGPANALKQSTIAGRGFGRAGVAAAGSRAGSGPLSGWRLAVGCRRSDSWKSRPPRPTDDGGGRGYGDGNVHSLAIPSLQREICTGRRAGARGVIVLRTPTNNLSVSLTEEETS